MRKVRERGSKGEESGEITDDLEGLVVTCGVCLEVAGDQDMESLKGHITKSL